MGKGTSTSTGSPLYAALAERIRESIRRRALPPGAFVGSEHALARRAGAARMTVRRASELLIREGLIERRPGKGLFVRSADHVAGFVQFVAGNLNWVPAVQIARGVRSSARGYGVGVQIADARGDADLDVDLLRRLPESDARGAIIVSIHSPRFHEALVHLRAGGFPFVLVDQRIDELGVPSVTADNHQGGYLAGRALLERGHRRIGFIGDLVASTVAERLAGLRDAVGDAGLPFDRSAVIDISGAQDRFGDWSADIAGGVRELFSRVAPPTAVFCSCDAVARSVYRALAALGLGVPGDVSVVGFDDDPLAAWLTPGLTTVHQPFFDMGRVAMELLHALPEPADAAVHRALPVALVSRDSVAASRPRPAAVGARHLQPQPVT